MLIKFLNATLRSVCWLRLQQVIGFSIVMDPEPSSVTHCVAQMRHLFLHPIYHNSASHEATPSIILPTQVLHLHRGGLSVPNCPLRQWKGVRGGPFVDALSRGRLGAGGKAARTSRNKDTRDPNQLVKVVVGVGLIVRMRLSRKGDWALYLFVFGYLLEDFDWAKGEWTVWNRWGWGPHKDCSNVIFFSSRKKYLKGPLGKRIGPPELIS